MWFSPTSLAGAAGLGRPPAVNNLSLIWTYLSLFPESKLDLNNLSLDPG